MERATQPSQVKLRYANDGDVEFFFTLRNDPVAAFMSCREEISLAEHVLWWSTTPDSRLVAICNNERVGTMRVSPQGVVSIIVHPDHRGRGIGQAMLVELSRVMKDYEKREKLYCEIRYENEASQTAFLNAGWRPIVMQRDL